MPYRQIRELGMGSMIGCTVAATLSRSETRFWA
jgi:hypothetical protein